MFRLGVKLSEIIKLPSLKNSEVIAGVKGLEQMVTSLSFLEISDMSFFNDEIQLENEYYGGEIVITSFYAVKDSIEKQCEAIRRLHKLGPPFSDIPSRMVFATWAGLPSSLMTRASFSGPASSK